MNRTLTVAAIITSAMISHASAQPALSVSQPFGDFYVGLSTGVLIPNDTDQKVTGTILGLPVSGAGKLHYKPGIIVDALVGYHINPYVAAEVDLAYARYEYDEIKGVLTVGPLTVNRSTFDGNVQYWMGFVNAIVTPLGRSGFSPYIGGGIGFSSYEAKINSISNPIVGVARINSTTTNTDFAANAIAGFNYAVSDNVAVGARYRFLWTDSARTATSSGLTSESSNAMHHILSATATYRF